jgi:hypothetical protein
MDWSQTLTIIGTMAALTGTSTWIFYSIAKQDIALVREQMKEINANHREDMKEVRESSKAMDAKWERLFEKLLVKETKVDIL